MFMQVQRMINGVVLDEPDPAAANALQEGLGGQFGEMRTMLQYMFQAGNLWGASGRPYKDLLHGIGTEEIGHVELIVTTIARLTGGSPQHRAAAAMPVPTADIPWLGSAVYSSGDLVMDLLDNLMLESTGRLQKCRIYEMTENKIARATIAYLIVRDQAHENAYAKALESLDINWRSALPIPTTEAERYPEVRKLLDRGLHIKDYTFRADDLTAARKIHRGEAPADVGGTPRTERSAEASPSDGAAERPAERVPGLDPALLERVQAAAEAELKDAESPGASSTTSTRKSATTT